MEEGKRRWGRRSRFARVKNWERPEGGTSSAVDETGDELVGGNQDNDANDDVDVDDGGGDDDDGDVDEFLMSGTKVFIKIRI